MTDTPSSASLTDRMRTCAAAIVAGAPDQPFMEWQLVYRDAADLLIEASNALEAAPIPLGEPMEIIPVKPSRGQSFGSWIDEMLPKIDEGRPKPRPSHACPKCDSRASKRVRRDGTGLVLVCPICAHAWPYTKKPPAEGTAGG